jgi:L-threonylcarbamoyladenylate synthase
MELSAAIAALERGEVIVFPTETLYGLGADASNQKAVEKVFQLKGRDPRTPIPVIVADEKMLRLLVAEVSPITQKLMKHFWPGPLTLVLPARAGTPKQLLNKTGGIGVRISSQPIATQLVKELGRPLTATSANPSGRQAASTVQAAKDYFTGQVDIFIDGGRLPSKIGSTVVKITGEKIEIVREGEISAAAIQVLVGKRPVGRS